MLADYYPFGSVPQLSVDTLFVSGHSESPHVSVSMKPCRSANLEASLQLDPLDAIAGLESRLLFKLDPPDGLEPYLGAWGHMLAASEDLVDLLHLHPFLTTSSGCAVQRNLSPPGSLSDLDPVSAKGSRQHRRFHCAREESVAAVSRAKRNGADDAITVR